MANSFAGWQAPHRLPLQAAPAATGSAGTSSFGMSGVNAHAIIARADAAASAGSGLTQLAWQRSLCCYVEVLTPLHPLLGTASRPKQQELQLALALGSRPALAFLWDHRVQGGAIMPGAAYFEAAVAAGHVLLRLAEPRLALTAAVIAAPLKLAEPASSEPGAVLSVTLGLATGEVSLRSRAAALPAPAGRSKREAAPPPPETLHLRGTLALFAAAAGAACGSSPAGAVPSADAARAACREPQATAAVYRGLAEAGLQYGPAFRLMRGIRKGGAGAAASLCSAERDADVSGFLLHPALLDNSLQLGAVVPEPEAEGAGGQAAASVPAGLAVYALQQPLPQHGTLQALVRRSGAAARKAAAATYRDHTLLGSCGSVLAVLDGLEAKQLAGGGAAAARGAAAKQEQQQLVLYEVAWLAAEVAQQPGGDDSRQLAPGAVRLALAGGAEPLPLAAGALGLLQGVLRQQLPSLELHTVATSAAGSAGRAGAAEASSSGLWGMLRAFGQEVPAISYGGSRGDAHALQRASITAGMVLGTHSAEQHMADGYGSLRQGSAVLRAALLPSRGVRQALEPFHLMPRPRGAFRCGSRGGRGVGEGVDGTPS